MNRKVAPSPPLSVSSQGTTRKKHLGTEWMTGTRGVMFISSRLLVLSHSVMSNALGSHGLKPARLLSIHGIFQARILEWVAIPYYRISSGPRDQTHISMKMKVKVTQSYPTLCDPMDYTVHAILQIRILEWAVFFLSLLQGIFPSQGSNPGLPHCMWILYQLSHKGSPMADKVLWYSHLFKNFPQLIVIQQSKALA